MLRYSNPALWVRRLFFAPYNDVTIIVEDMGKENFYVNLFQNLLGDTVKIKQVNGVGGKTEVIRHFNNRSSIPKQPEFFLVDGDFDELLGIPCPRDAHFYRLMRYDIEAFLIDDDALCAIAQAESPRTSAAEYAGLLQVQQWVSQVVAISIRLSAAAALWQELNIRRPRFQHSIDRHIKPSTAIPDPDSIQHYIDEMKSQQSVISIEEFDQRLEAMVSRMGTTEDGHRKWVSGKYILIPAAMRLLNMYGSRRFDKESFCFRLGIICDLTDLADLRERMLAIC